MSKEYEYKCPDCNENINYGDKFCKNCSCKLDWDDEETESSLTDIKKEEQSAIKKEKENKKQEKKKSNGIKKDNIKIGLIFILIQTICYVIGILTNNFSFKIESGDQLFEFIGYNIFLIIGIINIIKSKNYIKTFYKKKLNILLLLLIFVCLTISIVLSINSISIFNNHSNKNINITEININKYLKLISKKENRYFYLGSSDSKYTLELTDIIDTLDINRKINLYYLDISKLSDDEYTSLNNSLIYLRENEWGVPLLLLVKDEDVINYSIGIPSEKDLKKFFEKEFANISDDSNEQYYDETTGEFKDYMRASHILLEDYETANEIIKKLNDGVDFCNLAKRYSTDSTGENCGDIGLFTTGEMVEEFENAVIELEIGEYTITPIQSAYGYHVILRTN